MATSKEQVEALLRELEEKSKKTDAQVDRLVERSDRVAERLRDVSPSRRRAN